MEVIDNMTTFLGSTLFSIIAVAVGEACKCITIARISKLHDSKCKRLHSCIKRIFSPDISNALNDFSPQLVLNLLGIAIRQGSSITRALYVVGNIIGDSSVGASLIAVSQMLSAGAQWDSAWNSVSNNNSVSNSSETVQSIRSCLEASWKRGVSPLLRIENAIEETNRAQNTIIDEASGRLSVSILLPLGLCFLPAFIVIAVVPSIAVWGSFLWN